jgi:Restriction endonuclease EcoRV
MIEIGDFRRQFGLLTAKWNWEIEGFVDASGYIYPIDSDTKVLSTVFERLASPVIRKIAKENNYIVEIANQTTYPDFTLTSRFGQHHRIAVDVKSTYLSNRMGMTLGGYNSFLRNNTKNIRYPYDTYQQHWVVGFIYKQRSAFEEYDLDNMPRVGQIPCPYEMKRVFIRQKYEIAGLRAGSGNTKNIGSIIVRAVDDFETCDGPFTSFELGQEACDYYWKDYERLCIQIATVDQLVSHREFRRFHPRKLLPRPT